MPDIKIKTVLKIKNLIKAEEVSYNLIEDYKFLWAVRSQKWCPLNSRNLSHIKSTDMESWYSNCEKIQSKILLNLKILEWFNLMHLPKSIVRLYF